MDKCKNRKYKKPLLKECQRRNIQVNERMTIDELCSLLHSSPQEETKNKPTNMVQLVNKLFTQNK